MFTHQHLKFLIACLFGILFTQSANGQEWFKGELYLPMPQPTYKESIDTKNANQAVHFDMASRTESISTDTAPGSQITWVPGSIPSRSELSTIEQRLLAREFSNLSRVSDATRYPQRTNVKIFIKRGNQNFVCSGVLIDPRHVLTAGHCIHDGTWADEITVVPAFENGNMPFGEARSINLMSWRGWTRDKNFDHDLGLIILNHPIGLRTSWLGYGYNDNNNFFRNRTFHNFSYPAAAPFNGQTMHYRRGEFDKVTTYILQHNDQAFGGQSGSGLYFNNNGNRIVYGVVCHANNDIPRVGNTRITGPKFNDIRNKIREYTPNNSDLIPLAISRISERQVTGRALSANIRFGLFNHSRRNFNRNVHVEVYMSKNTSIGSSDVLVSTVSPRINVHANGWTTVELDRNEIVLPRSLGEGIYYLGIRLNVSDANTSNNTSTVEEVIRLQVEPGPFCKNRSTLREDSGEIADGSGNTYYANRSNCRWLIKPSSAGKFIRLLFDTFALAPGDTVYVYNGESSRAPLLGRFSGNHIPSGIVATQGAMYIQFRSNSSGRAPGWSATYQVLNQNPENDSPCLGPFPNPAHKEFYLLCPLEEEEVIRLELYDNTGSPINIPPKIDELGPYVFDISNLAKGIYHLRIIGEGHNRTEKILIQ